MRRKNLTRLLIVVGTLIGLAAALPVSRAQKPVETDFEKTVLPFLAENCTSCHGAKSKAGGLDLENFKTPASVVEHHEAWEQVALKLRTGEMPPKGMPRPPQNEIDAVVKWINAEIERLDRSAKPDPGRVTARRLNRAEYNNTVRDLLGVDTHPADNFPQDDSGYGFDNIGDVLSLSPVLMEKYLTAAEQVARRAVFGPEPMKPTLARLRPAGAKLDPSIKPLTDYDTTGLSLANALHTSYRFPVDAEYNFHIFLGGVRPAGSEPLNIALWLDGKQAQATSFEQGKLAAFSDDRQDFGGMTLDIKLRVPAGDHSVSVSLLRLYEGLPASYGGPNPSKLPVPPPPEFKPPKNLPPERLEAFRKRFEARLAEKVPVNQARITGLDIGGPYDQAKGASAESRKKLYVCGHLDGGHQAGCERKIISNLAHRAFRRPVTSQEVNKLVGLYALARKNGDSFEEGLVQSMQAVLVSPHFLFRIERGESTASADGLQPITQHELASRLSYFLWSSMPDDELLSLADQGKLRDAQTLAAQVKRMLKDPKSSALVENFGGQWLELRKLESAKPNHDLFPTFEEYLRASMRRETEMFFDYIVHEDRSILDFINADYTFLNERLAQLYQIPNVKGPEFRKVSLAGTPRGGILTQASVLTVSSYATRTSPVLRGKWVLENILNAPPPPPPPNVPTLEENKVGASASLRAQMEAHRTNPTCAACHSKMDPLGFGLENFDAIGGWRTKDGKFDIDSSGVLPDGRKFNGPEELKKILLADRAAFTQGLTEKLMTYALGRGLERYDRKTVKEIASRVAANDYRFSSLALEIVNSLPFQMRRGEKTL